MSPRILTFTTVYPRLNEPNLGPFVHSRIKAAANLAEIQVVAPVSYIEYGNPNRHFPGLRAIPAERLEDNLTIHHPRWMYPPLITFVNPLLLYHCCLPYIIRLRDTFHFQLIDAHFGFPDGVAAYHLARKLQIPYTVTLRGNETMHGRSRLRLQQIQRALRGASRVIVVSSPLRAYAAQLGVDDNRIELIPNGVDAELFHQGNREHIQNDLGVDSSKFNLLSAGYLIERKGHHLLAKATSILRSRGVDAHLWIAGGPGREGDFSAAIRRAVADLGLQDFVHFLGALPPSRLAEWMQACDVFCLASNREGWPNVVNEALACGTPVVSVRVGGIPELIPSDTYGFISESADPAAIAELLLIARSRAWDRNSISEWGTSRSWDNVASQVLKVWQLCLLEQGDGLLP